MARRQGGELFGDWLVVRPGLTADVTRQRCDLAMKVGHAVPIGARRRA